MVTDFERRTRGTLARLLEKGIQRREGACRLPIREENDIRAVGESRVKIPALSHAGVVVTQVRLTRVVAVARVERTIGERNLIGPGNATVV